MSSQRPDYYNFESPYHNFGFEAEMAHAQSQRRKFGCCFGGCVFGCLFFIVLILSLFGFAAYCLFSGSVPLAVSPETTIITGPLKPDGKTVDYRGAIQAIIKADSQPDENGFRDVLLGYGHDVFVDHQDNKQPYLAMCEELGIDPETPPTLVLPPLEDTANDLDQWLAQVSPGLDAVQTAVAKTHYFIPLQGNNDSNLASLSLPFAVYDFHGKLADAFWMRADIRCKVGDLPGYWQDTLAQIRLFRRVTFNQAWQNALTRSEDETALTAVSEIAATLPQWTPEQLESAIKDLESLPNWQDHQTTLKMIQFMLLDLFSALSGKNAVNEHTDGRDIHTSLLHDMESARLTLQYIAFDWNLIAKELNNEIKEYEKLLTQAADKNLDAQFEILQLRPLKVSKEQFFQQFFNGEDFETFLRNHFTTEGISDIFFASGRSKLVGAALGRELIRLAAGEMYRLQLMEESRCQALRLVLALERFHREHKKYPDSLDELRLQPIGTEMNFQYEKKETGYRLQNMVFQLDKRM